MESHTTVTKCPADSVQGKEKWLALDQKHFPSPFMCKTLFQRLMVKKLWSWLSSLAIITKRDKEKLLDWYISFLICANSRESRHCVSWGLSYLSSRSFSDICSQQHFTKEFRVIQWDRVQTLSRNGLLKAQTNKKVDPNNVVYLIDTSPVFHPNL